MHADLGSPIVTELLCKNGPREVRSNPPDGKGDRPTGDDGRQSLEGTGKARHREITL